MSRAAERGGDADARRAELDAELLAWMRESRAPGGWRQDEARFDQLALELFALQFEACAPYRRFCQGRGRTPEAVGSWRDVPAVPAGAFKELALRSFPAERTLHTFRTSGTSGAARGALHLDTLELYEASLLASFERYVLPESAGGGPRLPLRVLTPSPQEAPDSSLSHMFGVALRELAAPGSGFELRDGELGAAGLAARLDDAAREGLPVALCGTAFAFAHCLEAFEARGLRVSLPAGSRVMETGGFKGRARPIPPDALYTGLERAFGVPRERVVNQYGMTELGSQFYDSLLQHPAEPRRKLGPPWARVRILDPETGEPVAPGRAGALAIHDLANTGSVAAVLTADLGEARGDGFVVLGREEGAEARGCSLAAEALLGDAP